jgi:branched-chain amino acid transport system ATP-binding protein
MQKNLKSISNENVLLKVENLGIRFVDKVSLEIKHGQLVGLIGPNGAGKTTFFNMLTGVYQPSEGMIHFNGHLLNNRKPHEISRLGMSRTFQNIRLFKELTALENILISFHQNITYSALDSLLLTKKFTAAEKLITEKAHHLLRLFNLDEKAHEIAGSLPYGEQRKLEIVRALATDPKLILLDEPAAGMNHQETHLLMELIAKIRKDFNLTVLLIEHDMKLVMGICENIFVLDHGVKIEEGDSQKVRNSKKVIEAYLGSEEI